MVRGCITHRQLSGWSRLQPNSQPNRNGNYMLIVIEVFQSFFLASWSSWGSDRPRSAQEPLRVRARLLFQLLVGLLILCSRSILTAYFKRLYSHGNVQRPQQQGEYPSAIIQRGGTAARSSDGATQTSWYQKAGTLHSQEDAIVGGLTGGRQPPGIHVGQSHLC